MKIKPLIFLFPLLIYSCAFLKVKTFQVPKDVTSYERFCWLKGCEFTYTGPEYLRDRLSIETFKETITEDLTKKGYLLDDNDPQFLVNMILVVEAKSEEAYYPADMGVVTLPILFKETFQYLKGSLIIDVIDAESGAIFWRSDALKFLDIQPLVSEKHIQKAVRLSLKDFPARVQ